MAVPASPAVEECGALRLERSGPAEALGSPWPVEVIDTVDAHVPAFARDAAVYLDAKPQVP